MIGSKLCMYYSLGSLLWQLSMLGGMYLCNLSPISSTQIMLFIKVFTPLIMIQSYCMLRYLSNLESNRRRKDELSEVMLIVFSLAAFLFGTGVFHVFTVLLGAPFLDTVEETFSFACLCSSLTVFPLFVVNEARWDEFINYLPESLYIKDSVQDAVKMVTCFTVLGAWCGAFPIPLDWDRDWQVWPITCSVGAISGYVIGLFCVFLTSIGIISNVSNEDWKNKVT